MTEVAEKAVETSKKNNGADSGSKKIDLTDLDIAQRKVLQGGLKDAVMQTPQFRVLGAQQKVLFYSTMNMFANALSIQMLNLKGVEYNKKAPVPGNPSKKETARFMKFEFDFIIPGTNNAISVKKEWRYEDFG